MFKVDDVLMASGHFWCVFDQSEHPRAGRMVRAFAGPEGEVPARRLADALNHGTEEVDG